QILNMVISVAAATVLFAMIFKLMPSTPIAWKDVWIGAGVTAVLFEAGKLLIGLYLGKSGLTESFAAAGSLVVLLAWVYYAAQVFLLGAEFTKIYADEHGSLSAAKAMNKTEQTAADGKPVEVTTPDPGTPAIAVPAVPAAGRASPGMATAAKASVAATGAKESVVAVGGVRRARSWYPNKSQPQAGVHLLLLHQRRGRPGAAARAAQPTGRPALLLPAVRAHPGARI
ncbi:YhjD/YihY/BrkB family envelope integrity protein, partial [Hymenobacter sp.]|uniref:YihY/virulence factor BrkB family protein n=1 Tax=Hymenobacter sp. TaxID=1898978 RepID=UPI00286B4016